ncbi:MAG: methyltransferase, partial [Planctomycetota bacterium]
PPSGPEGERPSPERFPIDDGRVYGAYIAGRRSAAVAAGVRAGLFDRLAAAPGGLSSDDVSAALGWSARGTRSMLVALQASGLVELESERWRASADAAAYLTRGTPGSLWGLVDMEVDHFLSPEKLLDALERDDSSVYGGGDPWAAHEEDPAKARAFTAAMHSVSERPAAGFAERFADFGGPVAGRLLDVGGGSGALSIAAAQRHADLRCTIFDIAPVCPIAGEYVAAAGVSDRVDARAGNMFEDAWPTGYDAILLSQILHDWSFETGAELLSKAHAALAPGGRILIHEKLVEDGAPRPVENALVHLDMLVWTQGQQYTPSELSAALEAAGFTGVERTRTTGLWSVVAATRR